MAPRREEAGPEGQAGCFLGELANRDQWRVAAAGQGPEVWVGQTRASGVGARA